MVRRKKEAAGEDDDFTADTAPKDEPQEFDDDFSFECSECNHQMTYGAAKKEETFKKVGIASFRVECTECPHVIEVTPPIDSDAAPARRKKKKASEEEIAPGHVDPDPEDDGRTRLATREQLDGELDAEDEVTVQWGEEKFFPIPKDSYSSTVAGSVFYKTRRRAGETPEAAGKRAYAAAKAIGEAARDDKLRSYVKKMKEVRSGLDE